VTATPHLVAIEGLDGAGKQTLVAALTAALEARGLAVSTVAFPRYDTGRFGPLLRAMLHGEAGDATKSVWALATLFAADRSDWAASAHLTGDVVLLDRYIASNAAYGVARLRLRGDAEAPFLAWVEAMETGALAVPPPVYTVLLATSVELAQTRARQRGVLDANEDDAKLQAATAVVYDELAAANWLSPWTRVEAGTAEAPRPAADMAAEVSETLSRFLP
jgi:dTMP kinase